MFGVGKRNKGKVFKSPDCPDYVPRQPEPERVKVRYQPEGRRDTEWRMFTIEELTRGFSIHDVRKCPYCGTVYTALMRVRTCDQCGGPLDDKVYKVAQKVVEAPKQIVTGFKQWMGDANGMLQIKADDGDVQLEPFNVAKGERLITFSNTGLNFFVNRKNGCIVDIVLNPADYGSAALNFKVNGRNTGVNLLMMGLQNTVNNRMPTTIPIAAGSAIQMQAVEL